MNTTNNSLILIVEDEPKLSKLLQEYLTLANYKTEIIDNGLDVVSKVRKQPPSLMLLDVMLPGKDGIAICKEIRSFSELPIIMVTARVEEVDRLLGLELGADDYICKPFSPREVVARVKAVLRRFRNQNADHDEQNIFQIDSEKFRISLYGNVLNLTAVEFRLLSKLILNNGRVFSRDQLIDQLYADHRIVTERTVDTHIKNLRKKLEAIVPEQEIIRSVYGVGYKLEL